LQSMSAYSYKMQVQIIVALMTLHNYIRRDSPKDVTFVEFNCHLNFVPDNFLVDVVPCSESHGY